MKQDHSKDAQAYLEQKYGGTFSYQTPGSDVWSSPFRTYIFADEEGVNFTVRCGEDISDDYAAVRFDGQLSAQAQGALGEGCKVFISTKKTYFGADAAFPDSDAYLRAVSNATARVYSAVPADYDDLADKLAGWAGGRAPLSASVYLVTDAAYAAVKDGEWPEPSQVRETQSFTVTGDGAVESKSWGAGKS